MIAFFAKNVNLFCLLSVESQFLLENFYFLLDYTSCIPACISNRPMPPTTFQQPSWSYATLTKNFKTINDRGASGNLKGITLSVLFFQHSVGRSFRRPII